ncbi:exopolyphosphatase / guanosine-5'-triphosphate,3'-diphosphate pyrophosphatase [Candidatus Hakubella thermalkaliphila]|nr:exopolyphosphatase / guanosine-5'-triphosphate,3'-diphosphate pyrophosphatase [Candidatus Hakubella thermalkaliphila]
MLYGALDLGTNSTRLLIAEVENGRTLTRKRLTRITRLGKGVDKHRFISEPAMKRTARALSRYKELMTEYGVGRYRAVATSAVRDAANRDWFIQKIYESSGVKVDIISGQEEAQLSFLGATSEMGERLEDGILVVDVGGGSTEFILGDEGGIRLSASKDVGCVRMSERFLKSDPPTGEEIARMMEHITGTLKDVVQRAKAIGFNLMMGTAGTITNLSAINMGLPKYDPDKIHLSRLSREEIRKIFYRLVSLPIAQRKKVVGLEKKRADVMVGGTEVVLAIMEMLGMDELVVSEKDILDGIALELSRGSSLPGPSRFQIARVD